MKTSLSALVLAGITTALLAVALPAQAAPPALPAGDHLVAASCGDDDTLYEIATFIGIDSATGASTPVGAGNPGFECSYQQAWDATSSTLYGIIYNDNDNGMLVKWDYTTGILTPVGEFYDEVNDIVVSPDAMVIGLDGKAYALDFNVLYSVNLENGVLTELGILADQGDYVYGMSVDPTTGLLYGLEENGDLLLIDPLAVTAAFVATWPVSTDNSYGLAIDHAGTAWVVENPGAGTYSALWSTPLATFGVDPQLSGNIVDADGDDPVTWWAAIIYPPVPVEPALAATGLDAAPLALGGLLLAAAGAVLVTRRNRRTA